MSKREHHFGKVREYKERFTKLSTEQLVLRLNGPHRLIKEAGIAAREVLMERGVPEESFSSKKDPQA